jgi:DNA-binding FrmR family transcriptional regulator
MNCWSSSTEPPALRKTKIGIPRRFAIVNSCSVGARLRRIEGQIRVLQRMVEDDKYCIGILTQVAATKALQSVALGLLEEHLSQCVASVIAEGGDDATAKVREASESIARLVRS